MMNRPELAYASYLGGWTRSWTFRFFDGHEIIGNSTSHYLAQKHGNTPLVDFDEYMLGRLYRELGRRIRNSND